MNRILVVIVGAAVVALVGFAVIVLTNPLPATFRPGDTENLATVPNDSAAVPPTAAASVSVETAAATQRFDQWAKPLRDTGLVVTADRVTEAGETLTVSGLTLSDTSERLGWQWTSERASLYDSELFHLQLAGAMTFAVETEAGQNTWSGSAEAFGIAVQRDVQDALDRSLVVRIAGLSLATDDAPAPFTLREGHLRILLDGLTGLIPAGSELALRLNDLVLPAAAGPTLGATVKSFATQFPIDRSITRYSLQQVIDFFARGNSADVELGTVAVDWGALHFTGKGTFGLRPSGEPRGRLEVAVTDALTLLDSIGASGDPADHVIATEYAARLLELGRQPDLPALPMVISLRNGSIVLEGMAGEIPLGSLAPSPGT